MQDDVFPHDALESLLHTPLMPPQSNRSGRHAKGYSLQELFALAIASQEDGKPLGGALRFIDGECILPRERSTRWDIRLTDHWVTAMASVNAAFFKARSMADALKRSDGRCAKARVDWHAQVVFPGSPDQPTHVDDREDRRGTRCFYTMIVPLVENKSAGGTHFPTLNHTFASFGGALVFDGAIEHAGLGNRSRQNRYFLYAAIYTGKDFNCG